MSRLSFCPVCGRTLAWGDAPQAPFCSERCRLSDLYAWLNEDYVIPEPLEHEAEDGDNDDPAEEQQGPPDTSA